MTAESVAAGEVPGPSPDTAPALVDALRRLGDEFGPLGVAITAARMTDPYLVGHSLREQGVLRFESRGPKSATVNVRIPDDEVDRLVRRLHESIADESAVARTAVDAERRRVRHETVAKIRDGVFGRIEVDGEPVYITPERIRVAAELLDAGADPDAVWARLIEGAPL